jgi:Tol biopolymer transport system component
MGPMQQRPGADLPYADLWVYDVTSGQLERLTTGEGFEGLGVWSP